MYLLISYDYSCPSGILDGVSRLAPLPGNAADRTTASSVTQKNHKGVTDRQTPRCVKDTIMVCLQQLPKNKKRLHTTDVLA